MKVKYIFSKILPAALLTLSMLCSLLIGICTENNPILIAVIFPLLYFIFYFVSNVNKVPFPMYFFIAMCFIIGNSTSVSSLLFGVILKVCVCIFIAVVAINALANTKKCPKNPGDYSFIAEIKAKYHTYFSNNPWVLKSILCHCFLMLLTGLLFAPFHEYRSKWIILAYGAILSGNDFHTLTIRGRNFVFGAFIGCILAGIIGYLHLSVSVRAWVYLPAMIITNFFMPKVANKPHCYIIGSSMVALMAMVGNSLSQQYLTIDIVAERFVFAILGSLIAILANQIINKAYENVYCSQYNC